MSRRSIRLTMTTALVGGNLVIGTAHAQTAPPPAAPAAVNSGLENITVTARKRSEKLQRVPVSITALSARELTAANAVGLRDITFLVPGLTLNQNGSQAAEKPTIRGQVDLAAAAIGDNNVPVFFDNIYVADSNAIDFGLINLARVEVIEGPDSALYGHNAYAGAVNYVSAVPTSKPNAGIQYTVGDHGRENVMVDASGPIVGDVLTGGISGSYNSFDGTYHDSATGQNAGGYDRKDIFANLVFKPTDELEIRPEIYYGSDFFNDAATRVGMGNCGVGFNITQCGNVSDGAFEPVHVSAPGQYGQTGNERSVLLSGITAKYDFGFATLSSQTTYTNVRSNQYTEFDNQSFGIPVQTYFLPPGGKLYGYGPGGAPVFGGTPAQLVTLPLHFGYQNRDRDFSEEVRLTSPQDQRFRWLVGGFFDKQVRVQDLRLALSTTGVPADQFIVSPFAVAPGQEYSGQQTLDQQDTRIFAGFVSADFDITQQLTVSTEIRYQEETVSLEQPYAVFTPYYPGYSTGEPSSFNPFGEGKSVNFDTITSRNTLSYKPTPDIMLYFSAANGEKAGGFNNSGFAAFQPETNWTYEAGFKTTFLDNRLRFNAAYYHIDTSNYQISGPESTSQVGNFVTRNFGGLATDGVEASVAVKPIDGLTYTAAVGYTDPRFSKDAYDFGDVALCQGIPSCAPLITTVGANPAVKLSGLRPPYESNVTFNTSISLDYPIVEDWRWFARADYRFQSSQYYQYPIDTGSFGPLNNVNINGGISKGAASLTLWVKNLTDDKTPDTVQDSYATGGAFSFFESAHFYPVLVLPEGRTFGATFNYRFF